MDTNQEESLTESLVTVSLFVNLSNSLIRNEQIKTTLFKAKDLRPFIEKIISIGKNNNLHSKRRVFSILRDKESVKKVFTYYQKDIKKDLEDILE